MAASTKEIGPSGTKAPSSRRENGSAQFTPESGGAVDWGNLYAVTSFYDPKHKRRVQWGWSPEDMDDFAVLQQGFQGALSLPRLPVRPRSGQCARQ